MGGDGHGHGDHGHGHHAPYVIPDYRIYKVADCPKLVAVEKSLAAQGLKDPWLRNEAWRYHKGFGTRAEMIKMTFFRGFKYGFAAFVLTMVGTKIYERQFPDEHGHDHH